MEMQSTEIIIILRVRWKKAVKSAITLDLENVEGAVDIRGNVGYNFIRVEMPRKSFMMEFFENSDIQKMMQHIFLHIKMQIKSPRMFYTGLNQAPSYHHS